MQNASSALADAARAQILRLVDHGDTGYSRLAVALAELDSSLRAQRDERIAHDFTILVCDRLEPVLARRIAQAMPDGGQPAPLPGDLMEVASLYRACEPWLARRTGSETLSDEIEVRLLAFHDKVRAAIAQPDMPDLQPFAMALLRIEVLSALLEEAGAAPIYIALQRTSALLARDALRRVSDLVQAYLDDPPALQPRVDFAGVSSRFDDLLVIVMRVVEASADAERDTFLLSIGTELLDEFGNRLVLLVAALMRAAATLRESSFSPSSYGAVLLQLSRVHALCTKLRERALVKVAAQVTAAVHAWGVRAVNEESVRLREQQSWTEEDLQKSRALLRCGQEIGLSTNEMAVKLAAGLGRQR